MAFADENSVNDLDRWIEKLNDCKPLTETEVKLLCELVSCLNIFSTLPVIRPLLHPFPLLAVV
ncbi:hypothetical protein EON64_14615 [archaeon]|nr:MAG: hypothetical protein EON64_14615 [archaeon]